MKFVAAATLALASSASAFAPAPSASVSLMRNAVDTNHPRHTRSVSFLCGEFWSWVAEPRWE